MLGSGSVLLRSAHTSPSLSVAREIPRDSLRPGEGELLLLHHHDDRRPLYRTSSRSIRRGEGLSEELGEDLGI